MTVQNFTEIPLDDYKNSPAGRYEANKNRDHKIYCNRHPQLHPDNEIKIKLKEGSTTQTVNNIKETHTFRYCPKCFAISK